MFSKGLVVWPLILDNYFPGQAAIYSLRLLKSSFKNSPILAVRRSSDNATNNVLFDSNGVVSLSSPVTSGGPKLSNWTGSDNLFIQTWFDQSSNGNNATQATLASQPTFANVGVINTINGKPTIAFGNAGPTSLNVSNNVSISLDSALSFLTVCSFGDLSTVRTVLEKRGPGATYKGFTFFADSVGNANFQWNNNSTNTVGASASLTTATLYSLSLYATESTHFEFLKKTTSLNSGALGGSGSSANTNPLMVGGHVDTPSFAMNGNISEWMLFNNVLTTAQRNAMINNQIAYFGL